MDLRDGERGQPCGQRFPFRLGRAAVPLQHATCDMRQKTQHAPCNRLKATGYGTHRTAAGSVWAPSCVCLFARLRAFRFRLRCVCLFARLRAFRSGFVVCVSRAKAAPPTRTAAAPRPRPACAPTCRSVRTNPYSLGTCRASRPPAMYADAHNQREAYIWRHCRHARACMFICMYVCMHVCMYVRTYARMYVCM